MTKTIQFNIQGKNFSYNVKYCRVLRENGYSPNENIGFNCDEFILFKYVYYILK